MYVHFCELKRNPSQRILQHIVTQDSISINVTKRKMIKKEIEIIINTFVGKNKKLLLINVIIIHSVTILFSCSKYIKLHSET